MTAKEVTVATLSDPALQKLLRCLCQCWPSKIPGELKPFRQRRECLTVEGDCILWGYRLLVPTEIRDRAMDDLHNSHLGVIHMKALARTNVLWPGIDKAIEEKARSCSACQAHKNSPAKTPLHTWSWATSPWERIHISFAGPFMGKMFLVVTDTHSKWPDIVSMHQITTTQTVTVLRNIFACYGFPHQLVSDNGPELISEKNFNNSWLPMESSIAAQLPTIPPQMEPLTGASHEEGTEERGFHYNKNFCFTTVQHLIRLPEWQRTHCFSVDNFAHDWTYYRQMWESV